jgi:menaquinone-dependent protoporphyrinogen oxidase
MAPKGRQSGSNQNEHLCMRKKRMKNDSGMERQQFLRLAASLTGISLLSYACNSSPLATTEEVELINTPYGESEKMSKKVLVTYASRAGSTAGVVDAIGKTLAKKGLQVDVIPMNEVTDLSSYQSVVAGSAIRGQIWLPEAMDFLNSHQAELKSRSFTAFMVCITLAMKNGENYRENLKGWMAPVRTAVKPFSEGYFAGALDLSKLSGMDKMKMGFAASLGVFPKGDFRNWKEIEAWAESIAPQL